jgi:peptide/nickel transport system permease protein
MARYVAQRLLATVPVLLLVSVGVFALIHLIPGDPVQVMAGESQDPAVVATLRHQLGLDRPLSVQYVTWLGHALRGDLGRSIRTNSPVLDMIGERARPTLELSALALLIALLVAMPVGVLSATHRNSPIDALGTAFAIFGISMPNFVIGLILIFVFAVRLGWLPTSGFVDVFDDPVAGLRSLALPAITLGLQLTAIIARMTRSTLLESLGQDYVRTARAKGLSQRAVVLRHALRNALIPVVTIVGLQVGGLLAGAVITEFIFAIPGVGRLIVDAIFARDFPVVQGVVLVTALGFIASNLLADVLYALLDPRIRWG